METPQNQPIAPITPNTTDALAQSMGNEARQESALQKNFGLLVGVLVVLGILTGLGAAALTTQQKAEPMAQQTATNTKTAAGKTVSVGQVYGAKDATAFKDTVQGVLVSGGIGSEGSHHIVRPGGESQNVYLTSSLMDLSQFEGAKVKVSGETFKGQKAGWLMDVGRVEVLELNAALPESAPAKKTTGGDF